MEHDEIGGDGATEAFDGLRGEIALMRRAVERLAAEKADAPDYTVTLGKISRDQRQAAERLEAMANSPALSLTPVAIGTQVERVAADLRRADRQTIDGVRRELAEATKTITERVSSARSGERQSYWLAAASVSGFIAGLLFLILLGGPIARTFPARWHFPERIVAWAMGTSMREAGRQLMETSDHPAWQAVIATEQMLDDNKIAIQTCRKAAAKTESTVRCSVKIGR